MPRRQIVRGFVFAVGEYPPESDLDAVPNAITTALDFVRWMIEKKDADPKHVHVCTPDTVVFERAFPERPAFHSASANGVREAVRHLRDSDGPTDQLFGLVTCHGFRIRTRSPLPPDAFVTVSYQGTAEDEDEGLGCLRLTEIVDNLRVSLGPGNHYWFYDACRTNGLASAEPLMVGVRQDAGRSAEWRTVYSVIEGELALGESNFGPALIAGLRGRGHAKERIALSRYVVTFSSLINEIERLLRRRNKFSDVPVLGHTTGKEEYLSELSDTEVGTASLRITVEGGGRVASTLTPKFGRPIERSEESPFVTKVPPDHYEIRAHRGRRRLSVLRPRLVMNRFVAVLQESTTVVLAGSDGDGGRADPTDPTDPIDPAMLYVDTRDLAQSQFSGKAMYLVPQGTPATPRRIHSLTSQREVDAFLAEPIQFLASEQDALRIGPGLHFGIETVPGRFEASLVVGARTIHTVSEQVMWGEAVDISPQRVLDNLSISADAPWTITDNDGSQFVRSSALFLSESLPDTPCPVPDDVSALALKAAASAEVGAAVMALSPWNFPTLPNQASVLVLTQPSSGLIRIGGTECELTPMGSLEAATAIHTGAVPGPTPITVELFDALDARIMTAAIPGRLSVVIISKSPSLRITQVSLPTASLNAFERVGISDLALFVLATVRAQARAADGLPMGDGDEEDREVIEIINHNPAIEPFTALLLLFDKLNHGLIPSDGWPSQTFSDLERTLGNTSDLAILGRGFGPDPNPIAVTPTATPMARETCSRLNVSERRTLLRELPSWQWALDPQSPWALWHRIQTNELNNPRRDI